MQTEIINAKCGKIKGRERENNLLFSGIRYASAKRFELPEPISFDGVYDAVGFGPCCPQLRAYEDESASKNTYYYREFRKGVSFKYDEDCLYLNVYTPKSAVDCPVVIYIHGGNFTKGSADERAFDGEEYCKRGIIFISVNYRLNVFGFYADGVNCKGNLGLYDQLAAIEWTRENISAFGGNPERITLMGQSAGAMSIQTLISSPLTRGKVQRAIMLSGGGERRGLMADRLPNLKFWRSVLKKSGATTFEEFKSMPAKDVFYAWKRSSPLKSQFATFPVIDGVLSDGTVARCDIPCIIGRVKKDIFPRSLDKMAFRFSSVLRKNGADCYIYRFEHNLSGDGKGTFHSADLWYAIGAMKNCWRPFDENDFALSEDMLNRFAAFIKEGSPNAINAQSNVKQISQRKTDLWLPFRTKSDIFVFK